MSLLALLACLLAQHAFSPPQPGPLTALYGRLTVAVARRMDAGDRNSGILAWAALAALVLVPTLLATVVAAALHPAILWLLEVAVLYSTLRFLSTVGHLGAIEKALREGDATGAANRLAQWTAQPVESADNVTLSRLAARKALKEAHQGTFGPLFWYLVLPGPLGLVLYPLALRAARAWAYVADPEARDFGWFAARAFEVLDWVPQRLTAFAFAIAGNFDDALYCWRSQAPQHRHPGEGIVLSAGAGALGVRLDDAPGTAGGDASPDASLGMGEPPREEALASLAALLWRALGVWGIAFLLAAALQPG